MGGCASFSRALGVSQILVLVWLAWQCSCEWWDGQIVGVNYVGVDSPVWPDGWTARYQVSLDDGRTIFMSHDDDILLAASRRRGGVGDRAAHGHVREDDWHARQLGAWSTSLLMASSARSTKMGSACIQRSIMGHRQTPTSLHATPSGRSWKIGSTPTCLDSLCRLACVSAARFLYGKWDRDLAHNSEYDVAKTLELVLRS
eukprot:COSAG01_NODE_2344_length_7864_cov_3.341790_5_plen_201_part_00